MPSRNIQIGVYSGELFDVWSMDSATLSELQSIRRWIEESHSIPSLGRHALVRHDLILNGRKVSFAIKSFSCGSLWRDRYFRKVGTKARRSFQTAVRLHEHGVGTPMPLVYLDRWEGGRLLESYYLCEYQDNVTSFRDELNRLYREDPICRKIMKLMETVAYAIADMHDAGVCHRDLGNQNIMLRRDGDAGWKDVQFIDLNRAHLSDQLTIQQRGRDISRIDLPSDFLRVFACMYHRDQHPSAEFNKWENHYRKRYSFHSATRKYRHPFRKRGNRDSSGEALKGPELWVWDDRSVQAVSSLRRQDRHKYYPMRNNFYIARGLFTSLLPVYQRYRDLLPHAFTREVSLDGRFGLAVGTEPGKGAQEWPLLEPLGALPVLLRLYRHESDEVNAATVAQAKRLKEKGHAIFISLIQDRKGIRNPEIWAQFAGRWMPSLSGVADWLEIGHAINRVKWGVWDLREYRSLVAPVFALAKMHGPFKLAGPSAIDFEYHYLAALLDMMPEEGRLDALSHLMYVDRRGAPENRQSRFSSVEKFALAKAFAGWSKAVNGDKLIVSEVNWPLLNTGVYSPVCSPYTIPNSHTNDPSVDEDRYASYMVRYYMLALCSGFVDSVYWWRLVARGFGLVDDSVDPWRLRPAYAAMRTMINLLGRAVFIEKMTAPEGVWLLRFQQDGNRELVMAWAHPQPVKFQTTFSFKEILSRDGQVLSGTNREQTLTGSPVYFMDVR